MKSYTDKLKDSRWQRKRLETLQDAGWKCESCGKREEVELHVHHKRYLHNRQPWEYERKDLAVLCDCCHEMAHGLDKKRKAMLAKIEPLRLRACNGDEDAKRQIVQMLQNEIKNGAN